MSPQKFCITYFALVVKANFLRRDFFPAGFFRGDFFGLACPGDFFRADFFGADSEWGGNARAT